MNPYYSKVRSAMAMDVVGLDRLRFNEAVTDGFYSCAPETQRGKVRLFGEADLVNLFIFARLLKVGLTSRRAGEIACLVKAKMDEPWPALSGYSPAEAKALAHKFPVETSFVVVFGEETHAEVQPAIVLRGSEFAASETRIFRGVGRASVAVSFDVAHILDIVRERVAEQFGVTANGEADEDSE